MAVTKAKKGLGRGLSALIPDDDMEFLSQIARGDKKMPPVKASKADVRTGSAPGTADATQLAANESKAEIDPPLHQWIEIDLIEANPFQPRRHFAPEEMQDLIESIREHGILQPVLLRQKPNYAGGRTDKRYQLIAGERRWRAAQEAGLKEVPAIIRNVGDQQALELAVIENVQRHDISPLESAFAYRRLAEEFGLSQEDIARRVGKSRSGVANTLRLLDLPEEVQKALEDGALSEGHGRAILQATGDGSRRAVFRRILRDKMSVREAEQIARSATETMDEGGKASQDDKVKRDTINTPEAITRIQESLQKALGTRVKLQARAKGGRLQIEYYSNEDLSRIIELLLRAKP